MNTETKIISRIISDLEKRGGKRRIPVNEFYHKYFKKNKCTFEDDEIIISKLTKFYKDKDESVSIALRFQQVFTEIFLLNILKKSGYNYEVDFKNNINHKDVDFCIRLSDEEELLLEVWTPYDNKWLLHKTASEPKQMNREKARERSYRGPWDVGERWQHEVACKILNEAINRSDKFATGNYGKFLLFNISDFHLFSFERFWDKFFEDGRGLARGKDSIKNRENLVYLKRIKDFYTGLIFLSISETVYGTDIVSFYCKLFKQTNKPIGRFLKRLLKEERPRKIQYYFFWIKKKIREHCEWRQIKHSKKERLLKHKTKQNWR